MKPINKLKEILAVNLSWDKRRIDCFVKMLIAIIAVQTVNLTRLANYMGEKANIASRYRRLAQYYLTMDRTNWKWGKKDINVLFLGIVYKGAAIPIYWLPLNHRGNSSTKLRIALVKRFVDHFFNNSDKIGSCELYNTIPR
jgi:hypothetical protein